MATADTGAARQAVRIGEVAIATCVAGMLASGCTPRPPDPATAHASTTAHATTVAHATQDDAIARNAPNETQPSAGYVCGRIRIDVVFDADGASARLRMPHAGPEGERLLARTPAASGARYEAGAGASRIRFRDRGHHARLETGDTTWPECIRIDAGFAERLPLRAFGNEPRWSVTIAPDRIEWRLPGEDATGTAARPAPSAIEDVPGAYRYRIPEGFEVTAVPTPCADTMSGMFHPLRVRARTTDAEFEGCGGDPADLLVGGEWVVEDLDRGGVIDFSRTTLAFAADRRLSGRAGCNVYQTRYHLTGESLRIEPASLTKRLCPPALMNQERRFVSILGAVHRFAIDETGALILLAPGGASLTAR